MPQALSLTVLAGSALGAESLQVSSSCDGLAFPDFASFVRRFGRAYSGEEYDMRRKLFDGRATYVAAHNCAGEHSWKAQVNHLADWTEDELKSLRGYKRASASQGQRSGAIPPAVLDEGDKDPLPDSFSWNNLNSIKRPRDQGQCGSCWAYAATTVLDAHGEINNRSNSFSVAQIIACTPNPQQCGGGGGCDGATAELAYEYALQAGVVGSDEFPALPGGRQPACPDDKAATGEFLQTGVNTKSVLMQDGTQKHMIAENESPGVHRMNGLSIGLLGWTKFPENKEQQLVEGLVKYGPVAVAVAAGGDWNWYFKGILTPQGCDQHNVISHAVVLYGYGKANSVKFGEVQAHLEVLHGHLRVRYWHIKNSWGSGWGENGNMRLQRLGNEEEYCGWDQQPEVGSGCKGGPSKVWVCGSCGILYDTVMPQFRL